MPEETPARAEYVTDVPYPRKFIHQIAPQLLRTVAGLGGVAAPPGDEFAYCELGSGCGDTLALLGAANPGARFVGVDMNPEHVAVANGLVARGGLGNVRTLQADFGDLAREDLPDFDFITTHGVMSWVSPSTRDTMLSFVRAKLKPGGLFYVSYDALPGWAAVEPLRRLMLDHTAGMGGSTLDRAREGLAYAQRLADAGAGYFANHPTAKAMLGLMRSGGLAYVVHEHFHAHLQPFYFADMARLLGAYDLAFVGQVPLHLNVRELATPPAVKKMAEATRTTEAFETLKDFATNELFRSDVYVKGKGERSRQGTRAYFEYTPFGTLTTPDRIKREVRLPIYTLDFKGAAYDAILAAIAGAPASAADLVQRPALAQLGQTRIGGCLQNLVLGGQVVPMRADPARGAEGPLRVRLPYNEVALDEALDGEGPLVLASPVTGAGVHVSLLEALGIRLLTQVAPADHAAWLRGYARRKGTPLGVGDREIKSADELVSVMTRELDKARAAVPKLVALGVLDGPAP
jgi:SAM-dependent methyltransferase